MNVDTDRIGDHVFVTLAQLRAIATAIEGTSDESVKIEPVRMNGNLTPMVAATLERSGYRNTVLINPDGYVLEAS